MVEHYEKSVRDPSISDVLETVTKLIIPLSDKERGLNQIFYRNVIATVLVGLLKYSKNTARFFLAIITSKLFG